MFNIKYKIDKKLSEIKTSLKKIDINVYVLIVIHFLESFSEFSVALNLYFYLSNNFNSTDNETSLYFLLLFIIKKCLSIPVGIIIDKIELPTKKLMLLAILLSFIATIGLSFSNNIHLILVFLFIPHVIGSLLLESILHINIGRYNDKNEEGKTISYTFMYMAMNLGAAVSSNIISFLPDISDDFNKFKLLFTLCSISYIIAFSFSLFYKDPKMYIPSSSLQSDTINFKSLILIFKKKKFIRLGIILLILAFIISLYRFFELMFPKLLTREFNDINFPYGSFISVNEILILILVPIMLFIFKNFNNLYFLIIIGTLISSSSLLILIVYPYINEFRLSLFFIILTIGESIYSPRMQQIIYNIADNSNRGIVNAFASIMLSFSNIITPIGTSILLNNYCPQFNFITFECHKIWYWLFVICFTTPFLLILFENKLNVDIKINNNNNNNNNVNDENINSIISEYKNFNDTTDDDDDDDDDYYYNY